MKMKMFKHINKIMLAGLLLAGSACDSWLYLEPEDAIVKQEFWKTKEQVESAVIGAYSSFLGGAGISLGEQMFLWGELRADMVVPTPQAAPYEIEVANANILDTNPLVNWRAFYRTINYCNTVLQFAPQARQVDQTFQENKLNNYLGEVRTLRSLLYFYLVRSFGEAPLKLEATVSDDQELQIPKSSEETILKQIRRDLVLAEREAPVSHGSAAADKGRVTKYTVNALQADVYLWSELYDSAVIACDKIIQSNKFGLRPGASWHRNLFVAGNSNESIFELQYGTQRHPFFTLLSPVQRFAAAPAVLEELYTMDPVNPLNRDVRADGGSLRSDGSIWKYLGADFDTRRDNVAPYPNWILYRYADILLLKAEALNQLGRGEEALAIVKQIRDRANALEATEKTLEADDTGAIADYILEERARELAYEGKRWYDVLRNARRDNYARESILLEMVAKSAPVARQQTIVNKYRDHRSHYFPIYTFELQTNKNLVQNPFYK
jgi:starch-binding outer membrane protein, SusD/RagB family